MDVLQPNLDAMTEESMGHIATVTEIDTVKARRSYWPMSSNGTEINAICLPFLIFAGIVGIAQWT